MAKDTFEVVSTAQVPGVGRVVADPADPRCRHADVRVEGGRVLVAAEARKVAPLIRSGSLRLVATAEPAKAPAAKGEGGKGSKGAKPEAPASPEGGAS